MPGNMGRPTKLDQVLRHHDGKPVTVADHIVQAIGAGNYIEQAAASAGIDKTTLYDWQRKGARIAQDVEAGRAKNPRAGSRDRQLLDFSHAVALAQAEWLVQQNVTLEQASRPRTVRVTSTKTRKTPEGDEVVETTTREHVEAPDTSVVRWRMERMHPKLYGPTGRIEVSGPDGGPIPMDVRTQALAALGEAAAQLAQNAAQAAVAQQAAEEAQETGADGRPAGEPPAGPA